MPKTDHARLPLITHKQNIITYSPHFTFRADILLDSTVVGRYITFLAQYVI